MKVFRFLGLFLMFLCIPGCAMTEPAARDFTRNSLGLQEGEYIVLDFGVAYPETIQIDGVKEGKVYFQYFDSSEEFYGIERYDYVNDHELNACGILDLETNTVRSAPFECDEIAQRNTSITLQSGMNHHIMESDIGFFTAALGQSYMDEEHHIYTYVVDYKNHTREIVNDYGVHGYSAPHHLCYDEDTFYIYFEDEWAADATIYRYETADRTAEPIIRQPENTRFFTAGISDDSIWVYGVEPRTISWRKRQSHYFYRYDLNGEFQERYQLPEEIAEDRTSSTDVFIPRKIACFDDDIFYIEDFGLLNYYYVQLRGDTFQIISHRKDNIDPNLTLQKQTGNLPLQIYYYSTRISGSPYLLEIDAKKGKTREFQLLQADPEQPLLVRTYADETGGIIVQKTEPSWKLTTSEEVEKNNWIRYIPRKTIKKYSSKWYDWA